MMDAVSKLQLFNAAGGDVGKIEETSDWSYFFVLEGFFSFPYFSFFVGDFEGVLEGDFGYFGDLELYFYLLFDLPDLTDFSPYAFFLLFESPAIWILLLNNNRNICCKKETVFIR